jgi:hypothetical protein
MLEHPGATSDALGGVLAAAAARTADGPAGEGTALAQFRAAAARGPQPAIEGVTGMSKLRRKIIAAPLATLGVAGVAVATGGVAFAASQGAVHVPFTGHDNRSDHAPAAPASTNPGLTRSTATATDEATPSAHPTASPSPSLVGLCHAYLAGATHDGKTNPAFNALTEAAGGADNVRTYCVTLLAGKTHPAKPTQAASPTHPAHPTHPAKPTQAASPTHPAHPAEPAGPAAKTHPTHPAKPTQAASPTPPAGSSD